MGRTGRSPRADGALLRRVGRWVVSVQPWLDGAAGGFADRWSDEAAEGLVRLLAALHAVPASAVPAEPEDLALPGRRELEAALAPTGAALGAGPLAGAVRELLTRYGDACAPPSASTTAPPPRRRPGPCRPTASRTRGTWS